MNHTLTMLLWGLGALVAFHIIRSIFTSIQNTRKARQLGCEEAPWLPAPAWDILGLRRLRDMMAAGKALRVPEHVMQRHLSVAHAVGFEANTYRIHLFGKRDVFTADPKNVQAVLATQFKDFGFPPTRKANFRALLGNGIFASDGKIWEHSRALLRPSFAREQVSNLDLEERHNANLLRAIPIKPVSDNGWTPPADMDKLFFRLTLDTSTEFLFGESVDSQLTELNGPSSTSSGWKRENLFGPAFDRAQHFIATRGRLGRSWWLMRSKEFDADCAQCEEFIDHYVRLALQQDTKSRDPESTHKYVFLEELAQRTRDPIELRYELINILLAGRDTTASLLSWLVLLLARNPEKFAKLRQAILADFGSDSSSITFAKLKSCAYLQASLSEALRLYPVVPLNARHTVTDTTLPRGGGPRGESPIFVPAGTDVVYSVYIMHRLRSIWGSDADDFVPERFLKRKHGFEFLPFNGGPRVCLGQNFALTSAGYATVKLLQKFDGVCGVQGEDTMAEVPRQFTKLTMKPAGGCVVQWKIAQES